MKRFPLMSALVALLPLLGANLDASDAIQLETNIYVFKRSDFTAIKIPQATGASEARLAIFSDGVAQFDDETLSLEGTQFTWSGGQNPPNRFTLIGAPSTSLVGGKQFTLVSAVPVQYAEKRGDGTLKIREIPADSPDAPHFRVTFTLLPQPAASQDLRVSCLLDIATIASRTKVSGVALEVGKPVLAQFNDKIELTLRPAEWSAFALQSPNGSDYNLLMLLKATPESGAAVVSAGKKDARFMTAEEIAQFATFYYQHPEPDLIARMLESLGPSKFFPSSKSSADELHRAFKAIGFIAEIFSANPNRVAEWRKIIDGPGQNKDTRFWLNLAFDPHRPTVLINPRSGDSDHLVFVSTDYLWGAFFASGNREYLRLLVDRLAWIADHGSAQPLEGADVMVSLAYNAPYHPLVRQTLEESRQKASRATRALIDDLLVNDLPTVRRKARGFVDNRTDFPDYPYNSSYDHPWGIQGPTLSPMLQHAGDNADQAQPHSSQR